MLIILNINYPLCTLLTIIIMDNKLLTVISLFFVFDYYMVTFFHSNTPPNNSNVILPYNFEDCKNKGVCNITPLHAVIYNVLENINLENIAIVAI